MRRWTADTKKADMDFSRITDPPFILETIRTKSTELGFGMASDAMTGALLRTLVGTKPGGRFLELGTGAGQGIAWMLDGMDATSHLISVETDEPLHQFASEIFQRDDRVSLVLGDGGQYLKQIGTHQFDLIFADAWPGKYSHLEEAIASLKPGGLYVIDDMSPQPNWPEGHGLLVDALADALENRNDLRLTKFDWSTGVIIAAKTI